MQGKCLHLGTFQDGGELTRLHSLLFLWPGLLPRAFDGLLPPPHLVHPPSWHQSELPLLSPRVNPTNLCLLLLPLCAGHA